MTPRVPRPYWPCLIAALLIVPACLKEPEPSPEKEAHSAAPPAAPTNRVDIPEPVRRNLGITFAKVERRPVAQTLRVPGRFERLADATREYRIMLPGEVELVAAQFDRVEAGTLLFRLRSPRWRELQQQIAAAEAAIRSAQAASETIGPLRRAHRVHEQSLEETVQLWTERVAQLEAIRDAGGGKADALIEARSTLAGARAELADVIEQDADLEARERGIAADLDAALAQRGLLLANAAALSGTTAEALAATGDDGRPGWRAIEVVEVRAAEEGVVEALAVTNGAWAEEAALVLSTVRPERVRFHAHGLQSDLLRFRDGLPARITPPGGSAAHIQSEMRGTLLVGLSADADERTVDLYVTPEAVEPWARSGVSAYLEVALAGGSEELAIPLSAIARDGLSPVLFRRDPKDPDKAIRLDADLGIDDGRWVVVQSGLREGDEVVLDGVYQLMLATSGSAAKGGHFHSDGTFHEGEDE